MKPRNDCSTDDLWMPESGGFVTMDVFSDGQKGPLGFDLQKRDKQRKKNRINGGKDDAIPTYPRCRVCCD
jgi:hypothetical protein